MANEVLFIQAKSGDPAIEYDGVDLRKFVAATYPIEGVLGVGQLKVTQRAAGANMSVDVAPGGCAVQCDWVPNGGTYLSFEDATVNVTIPSAPTSGSRTHLIVEQVLDPQSDGQSAYTSGPLCIADTGSGATLPKSAYLLATVTVNAGQASVTNASIADQRNQASGPPPATTSNGPTGYALSGSGRITVSHGLGQRPRNVFTQLANAGNDGNPGYKTEVFWNTATPDDTSFIVQISDTTNGAAGAEGQKVYMSWRAER